MRLALISDIHGCYTALEAVLDDIARERADQIVCLGDVATLGPQPREVIARIQGLGCACVMGNHDSFLLDPDLIHTYTSEPVIVNSILWCARQLVQADFDAVRSYQPLLNIPFDTGATLLCCHGSPRSNTDNIRDTTPATELDAMLKGYTPAVLGCGHTHIQMLRRHKDLMVVNPGSAGQPFAETPSGSPPRILPWAEYAIVDWGNGTLGIELRRVRFDLDAMRRAVLASDIPLREWLLAQVTPASS